MGIPIGKLLTDVGLLVEWWSTRQAKKTKAKHFANTNKNKKKQSESNSENEMITEFSRFLVIESLEETSFA